MSDSGPSSVQAARDSPHAPQAEPAEGTTHSTPVVKGDKAEPRKCWICFADETDDGPTASEWPDLQAPGRQAGPGGWVRCPQCNSRIIVAQPRNPIVSAANRLERAARILVYPGLGLFAAGCIYSGLAMHGLYSLEWVFGQDAAREILMRELSSTPRVGGSRVVDGLLRPMMRFLAPTALSWEPWNWTLRVDLPLVPVVLLLSRTRFADPILRVLPLFFFAFQAKDPNPLDLTRGIGPGQAHNAFDREVAEELDGGELMMAINDIHRLVYRTMHQHPMQRVQQRVQQREVPHLHTCNTGTSLIRYHLNHRLTPRPLRLSRLRALRHWTIHRAWMVFQRGRRRAQERELERAYNSMRDACEALRVLPVGDGSYGSQGLLFRRAMHKEGVYDGWPIEATRSQTEWPPTQGWNAQWRR
ncbi:MAG: hypothetical protein M1826_004811 [Phylliscum demangeonii]|nr:MAG: hypothetical protein M1826_004811 [Phylliscum demangeonii]